MLHVTRLPKDYVIPPRKVRITLLSLFICSSTWQNRLPRDVFPPPRGIWKWNWMQKHRTQVRQLTFIFFYLSLILHSFSASCYFAMRFPHGHDRDRHSRKGRRHRGRATRSPVRLFTFSLSLLTLSNRSFCAFLLNRRQASERGVRLAALIIVLTPENAPPLRPLSAFYNVFCRSFPDTFNTLLTHFSS